MGAIIFLHLIDKYILSCYNFIVYNEQKFYQGGYVMKKIISGVALLLCLIMVLPTFPVVAANINTDEEANAVIEQEETLSSYSYNGYKTYLVSDATFKWTTPDTTEGGASCTAVQGMNTGTTYCYVAKISSGDAYCDVTRINMDTGAKTVMNYYSSTSATSSSANNTMGHANDITVVGINSVNYMYVATMEKSTAITRLKIDGTKLMLTGYFDLVNASGTSISVSAIKGVKVSGGYAYFLLKSGNSFYNCKIPEDATGGTASNPTAINVYKIFTIDTRNAVVAKSNSSAGTYSVDDWTNQGFGYNKAEKVLYVPIWDSSAGNRNLIITYDLSSTIDTWLELTANASNRVYPTKTSFMIQNTSYSTYEIESVGFRTGQGTTGDLKMYYNINCSTASAEGVYSVSYTSGSGDFTPVTDGKTLWTTKYKANGGSGTTSNTYHVYGISTKLRANAFTRTGYTFAGWYLTRKSDGKWLYFDADGGARWYTKGTQPSTSVLALYENQRSVSKLTATDGDTVTCYAQWVPNATGTTSFYIQYDANGGTGTMADTKVVYGTSTAISTNTFTKDGYIFTGWNAYRRNKAQWVYKDIAALSDKWLEVTADTTGYIRKTYSDGSTTAKATSVDQDIVTFYAAWTRIVNGVYPTTIEQGNDFTLGGTIESDTDMYSATVRVKNSAGTVVASNKANPYTDNYDISAANSAINFGSLAVGTYTLEVLIETVNTSTPTSHTLLSSAFEVINPARLELTAAAVATGLYTLGDTYFQGFGEKMAVTDFKQLFQYEISIVDVNGNAVTDTGMIGTGWVISCAGESRTTVLTLDINCDAVISSADLIALNAALKQETSLTACSSVAADADMNGTLSASDVIAMKQYMTN